MNIAAAATSLSQAQTASQVDYAVARKALDAQKQQGDAAIALLEAAANTGKGASPDGVGAAVDVQG